MAEKSVQSNMELQVYEACTKKGRRTLCLHIGFDKFYLGDAEALQLANDLADALESRKHGQQ